MTTTQSCPLASVYARLQDVHLYTYNRIHKQAHTYMRTYYMSILHILSKKKTFTSKLRNSKKKSSEKKFTKLLIWCKNNSK